MERERTVYRPFALLAFGAAILGGIPLGIRMLAWLYAGASAVSLEWVLLHANLQLFGFFATLIVGVAPHLLARFTGRALVPDRLARVLAGLLGAALVVRVAGTWTGLAGMVLVGAALQAVAFALFARAVWRALDPPPLAIVRRQLALSSIWLAAALNAGVLGWVLGVLLRAGPMFVTGWQVRPGVARALPIVLAVGAVLAASEALGAGAAAGRLGDAVALGGGGVLLATAGAFRHVPKALPMLSRSVAETRIARIALISLPLAVLGAATVAVAAVAGREVHVAADAVRHLLAVGFVTSVVVAMAFRLIPVLEGVALPWPRLRHVALVALAGAVVLRSVQVLVPFGPVWLVPAVAASGPLVWIAVAAVAANLVEGIRRAAD